MRSQVGSGPRGGYNAKAGAGWTGLRALRYAGKHTAKNRAYSYNKVFDVDVAGDPVDAAVATSSIRTSSATTSTTRARTRPSTCASPTAPTSATCTPSTSTAPS